MGTLILHDLYVCWDNMSHQKQAQEREEIIMKNIIGFSSIFGEM